MTNLKTATVDALADKHLRVILRRDGLSSRESYQGLNIHQFWKCFLLACQSDFISDMNGIYHTRSFMSHSIFILTIYNKREITKGHNKEWMSRGRDNEKEGRSKKTSWPCYFYWLLSSQWHYVYNLFIFNIFIWNEEITVISSKRYLYPNIELWTWQGGRRENSYLM